MTPSGEPTFGFFSFLFGFFMGPMKASLIADTNLAIWVGLAHQWASLAFLLIFYCPAVSVELFVFPFLPYLDVPYIEWGKLFGIENDDLYASYSPP